MRGEGRRALALALLAALPAPTTLLALATLPARADPAPTPLDQKQTELRGLQDTIDATAARRAALANEIAGIEADHAKLAAALIETTSKVNVSQAKVADIEKRLDTLGEREGAARRTLESRKAVVAEVLAALQRMGRKPPPALLVDPEDVLKAIRTSMLLGDLLPAMRSEVERLVVDLTTLTEARKAVQAERRNLDAEIASLNAERERLSALVEARQAALGKAQGAMADEAEKAKRLAGEAGSLKDLIGRMERDDAASAKGAAAARQSDAKLAAITPDAGLAAQPFKDPARLAPAVAFDKTRGLLPMPVSGALLRGFGDDDGLGGTEKGMLLATPVTAPVTAPADGWIAYAGPYRSFGQLLILNVGSGYYIVLAGMDRINVGLGQFVLAGEPIGAMGDGSAKTAAAVALGAAQPLLYVEFRKDGATIDPGPWWARPELQKVRG
ncbi:hypothetical protein RHAL1_03647 [Beijerinckiaceae bacterium RH AL1]|nr:hypothetical protein RHCH11_RHCH11_03579 [Beijerinckiaceae bacterium RH CH11]VVB49161.1 hypothetical protein RHAL8_03575 [Beijerinckiaceae bacterium RH AL8]VVC56718.1 hypothetical protein RHAL1_03647 [Beijerinckiaceae bacterium RH AL1]